METRLVHQSLGLILILLAAPAVVLDHTAIAFGQARVFMLKEGTDPVGTPAGPTTILASPGQEISVFAWIEDPVGIDNWNFYKIINPWFASGGDSGTVSYVDVNPGMGGGNSVWIDKINPEWVGESCCPSLEQCSLPSFYVEQPSGLNPVFGAIYNCLPGSPIQIGPGGDVPNPGGPNYLLEFKLQVSADACGTFELPFNLPPAPAPVTEILNTSGLPYGGPGGVSFEPLQIVVDLATCAPRAFMLEEGTDPDGTPAGPTTIIAEPGEQVKVLAWLQDPLGVDTLNAYQLVWPYSVACAGGGTISYVNINPGAGGGNSVFIDKNNPDWVFFNSPAAQGLPTFLNEDPPDIFGAAYFYVDGLGTDIGPGSGVPHPGQPNYIAQFRLQVSPDCCGTAVFPWNIPDADGAPPSPPFAAIFNQDGNAFGGVGAVSFDPLNIIVEGLPNDDCVNAIELPSEPVVSVSYDTACATPDYPAGADDIWFSYTTPSTCDNELVVYWSGFWSVCVYYADNCPPSSAAHCGGLNFGVPIFDAGTDLLIRASGENVTGFLVLICPACIFNSDCDDGNPCTTDVCIDEVCTNSLNTNPCSDNNVCTVGDQCMDGSCVPGPVNECTDFSSCTTDVCDPATPGDGCVNEDIHGQPCDDDADCGSGTCVDGVCDCQAPANVNPPDTLCLDVRGCDNEWPAAGGVCESQDAECTAGGPSPDGVLQCSDDDANPLNGGICVDQCCYTPGGAVVVDVELGPTPDGVCGAQVFLDYDESCLTLESVAVDPDGETGLDFVIASEEDHAAGEIDLVISLPPGTTCGPPAENPGVPNDTLFLGGTIARLTFTAAGSCKCGGVTFRPHNPPTLVSGPKGDLETLSLCPADDIQIQGLPVITCPDDSAEHAHCGDIFRTVTYGPVTVTDECEEVTAEIDELCEVEFRKACQNDLDCGRGQMCGDNTDCHAIHGQGSYCLTDPLVKTAGFFCEGAQCFGYCTLDFCSIHHTALVGVCLETREPETFELDEFLDCSEGCALPPGQITIECSYTNGCGRTAECHSDHFNSGLNVVCVDVELSPHMLPGDPNDPNDPITRCIDFEVGACDAAEFPVCNAPYGTGVELCSPLDQNACVGHPEACFPAPAGQTMVVSRLVNFGLPEDIAGHGAICLAVPPGNWTCLTASDPKHSLTSTCTLECTENNVLHAAFKGSKDAAETCHWLVQGNLNGDDAIDIADYTILAGEYLANYDTPFGHSGEDTLCKPAFPPTPNNFHADFNGDGLVTLADWTFVVFNFFNVSKDPCSVVCGGDGAAVAGARPTKPRSSMTRAELERAGLGAYVQAADADGDGVVNVGDMRRMLETIEDDGTGGGVTVENLREAARMIERLHRERVLLPRNKRGK